MRRSIPFLIASLAFAPLAMTLAPRARAEDAPDDQSPAAKAYRDAWWAETGGGNLNIAIEGYTKAADAEGPASVRARALYRKAIVLQRIGKTEEAIRTLERLAKDHLGEAALQTDARARLAEWTAVDLKTSFAEWYQRYQYSPEFQAKIVDLVLKLGANDGSVTSTASSELLTIGAPAIPALRQHVKSANYQLWENVVTALLRLGDIPALEAIRGTSGWRMWNQCWETLAAASPESRARLKAEAKADLPFDQLLLASLEGPVALLTWASTPAAKGWDELALRALSLKKGDAEVAAALPLLLSLAEDKTVTASLRGSAMSHLLGLEGVDAVRAERWASGDEPFLRNQGVKYLTGAATPEAVAALRRVVKRAPTWDKDAPRSSVFAAVLAGLVTAPVGEELDRLVDDLLPIWTVGAVRYPLSTAARDALARMVDRATDWQVVDGILQTWQQGAPLAASDVERLAGWVRSASWERLSESAAQLLVTAAPAGKDRALAMLGEPDLAPAARRALFSYLLRSSGGELLLTKAGPRRALLAALRRAEPETSAPNASTQETWFLQALSRAPVEARIAVAEDWLTDPVGFPRSVLTGPTDSWNHGGLTSSDWRRILGDLAPAWRKAWPTWTPAQRDAAIEGLGALLPSDDDALQPFLRTCVRDQANGISAESRQTILRQLQPIELADLRATFDLSTPQGTDAAISLAFDTAGVDGPERTPELFEALKLGLRPDGSDVSARELRKAFQDDPRVQRPLMEALLAHQVEDIQQGAVGILAKRESSEDLALWLKALTLPSADIRATAATGLGRIAHPDATKALVAALDDPNSRVRDAAIASLEAIQKVEDLKKTWREKVR